MGMCQMNASNMRQVSESLSQQIGKTENPTPISSENPELYAVRIQALVRGFQIFYRKGFLCRRRLEALRVKMINTVHMSKLHRLKSRDGSGSVPDTECPRNESNPSPQKHSEVTSQSKSTLRQRIKPVLFKSQEQTRPKGTHAPDSTIATRLKVTPTDYPLIVQQTIFKNGAFRYQDYIKKPQSQHYTPSIGDQHLPFLDPYLLEDGTIYIGQWYQGHRQGKGKLIYKDGSVYEGYQIFAINRFWYQDQIQGIGRIIYLNGDFYIGDWKQGKWNGLGQYSHADGTIQKGEWLDNQLHGNGEETLPNGTQYRGGYENGKKCGYGEYSWPDGGSYKGQFKNNMFEGEGTYVWPDGRTYRGYWKKNKMNGRGKFFWNDGRYYEGDVIDLKKHQYFDDLKHGFGKFRFHDGKQYEGYWQNGKMHGDGQITDANGNTKNGRWIAGKLVR